MELEPHEIAYLRSAGHDGILKSAPDDVNFQRLIFEGVIEVVGDKLRLTKEGEYHAGRTR